MQRLNYSDVDGTVDFEATTAGVQIDASGRLWVCLDGQCVLRARGLKRFDISDLRIDSRDEEPE